MIWQDRNQSCGQGAGCLQHLKSTRKIQHAGLALICMFSVLMPKLMPPHAYFLLGCLRLRYIGVGYHQNIREWGKKPAVEWLPIFRQMFWAPVPQEPPAPLPSSTDLVIYFRSFFDRSFFDVWHMQMRVGHMPLAYYRWAAQHHRRVVTWPLAEQSNYVRLGAGITSTESAVAASSAPQTNRYGTLKSGEMFRALLHCCADLYGSDGPAVCRSHQGLELS